MNTPSVKALREAFGQWLLPGQATMIKRIMDGPGKDDDGLTRMQRIDRILGTHGVEYQSAGSNKRSPAFCYLNSGDTYAVTILKINGRFKIGTWGDIVERGNYA